MTRHWLILILLTLPLVLGASDVVTPPCPADIRLSGYVARKMDALVRERFMTDFARTTVYDEAENAFRTHCDDLRTKGLGWWQGEYWGKTMLSAAEVYSHTHDEGLKNFIQFILAFLQVIDRFAVLIRGRHLRHRADRHKC